MSPVREKARKPRLTNAERQAQTRRRLLEAAGRVFARRGFHGASVDEIAAEAGYSTGALYHQFRGKNDLFLAMLDQHREERMRDYTEAFASAQTNEERARGGGDRWMAFLRDHPDFFPLFIEFWAAAVRDPELRPRFAEGLKMFRAAFARQIEEGARVAGLELPDGFADRFGIVLNALGNGMALEKLADPDGVPDELLGDAVATIFEGLMLLGAQAEAE